MIEVGYDITDSRGARGRLRVRGGIWCGDECVFEFADTLFGMAGTARCNWRQAAPRLDVHTGDSSHQEARALLLQLSQLLLPFHSGAFRQVTDADLAALYAGDYHRSQNYATNSESETRFKRSFVELLLQLVPPGKMVDAGCSAGEVVRQLRQHGVGAWGFDLCGDLAQIAYPEVRPFLRQGDVTAIPFDADDGIDTLLAFDLFEHVPEHRLDAMVAEFERLGVRRVIAHIALCEFQYAGHITLRPLRWWDDRLRPTFARRIDRRTCAETAAMMGADPSRYLAIYERVQVPALLK